MFLLVECAGRRLALTTRCVREIVPVEPIYPRPHFPKYVLGLSRVRGDLLPVLDLGLLTGAREPARRHDRTCFVIVGTHEDPRCGPWVALVVDRILRSEVVGAGHCEPSPRIGGAVDVPHLVGIVRCEDGLALQLDLTELFRERHLAIESMCSEEEVEHPKTWSQPQDSVATRGEKLLVVHVAGHTFGAPLREVGQLVQMGALVEVDDGPKEARLFRLDDGQMVLGIDVASALGLDSEAAGSPLALVSRADPTRAFLVASIGTLLEGPVRTSATESARLGASGRSRLGFADTEDGPLEVLSLERLLDEDARSSCDAWWKTFRAMDRLSKLGLSEGQKTERAGSHPLRGSYLIVECGRHWLAIDTSQVREIVPASLDLEVQGASRGVMGLIDLRQSSIPVLDLRQRLDLDASGNEEARACILVVRDGAGWTGVRIDRVLQWTRLGDSDFPDTSTETIQAHPHFFRGAAQIDGRAAHVLDLQAVLVDRNRSYREELRQLRAGAEPCAPEAGDSPRAS